MGTSPSKSDEPHKGGSKVAPESIDRGELADKYKIMVVNSGKSTEGLDPVILQLENVPQNLQPILRTPNLRLFVLEDFNLLAILAFTQQILEYSSKEIADNQERLLSKIGPIISKKTQAVNALNQASAIVLNIENQLNQLPNVIRELDEIHHKLGGIISYIDQIEALLPLEESPNHQHSQGTSEENIKISISPIPPSSPRKSPEHQSN